MLVTTIFSISVSLLFFLSGVLKIFSNGDSKSLIYQFSFLPEKVLRLISVIIPLFEIVIAVLLIVASNYLLVNILTIVFIIMLASYNLKAIIDRNQIECHCFGKLISTKSGFGGLIQCLLLLLSIVPNIIFNTDQSMLLLNQDLSNGIYLIFVAVLWTITLIIFRKVIEILYVHSPISNNK